MDKAFLTEAERSATGGTVKAKYGFIIIPGTDLVPSTAELIPERGEYPIHKCWHEFDSLEHNLKIIERINRNFLRQFGNLPELEFTPNATLPLSGGTYSTPAIRFRYMEFKD